MLGQAFGELKLTPDTFYRMTMAEYILAVQGHIRAHFQDVSKFRDVAYQVYMSYPSREAKLPKTKYMRLPTDNMTRYSEEETRKIRKLFIDRLNRRKNGGK